MGQKLPKRKWLTYSDNEEDNHQCAFGYSAWSIIAILSEEEQCGEAYLLNVQPNENMLECLGEEHASSVVRARLLQLPKEEVLVQHEEKEESDEGEAVDYGRDYGVCNS